MTPFESALALRRRWRAFLVIVGLGVAGAIASILLATPQYRATTQLFVAADANASSGPNLQNVYEGGLFTQQRVESYVQLASSSTITGPVVNELGLRMTPAQLGSEISATAPPNTVLLNISVTDPSARRAQAIASAVAAQFERVVARLEQPNQGVSPIKLSVSIAADLPRSPSSPKKALDLTIGLILGLLLGVVYAVIRERLDTRVDTADDLASDTGVTVLATVPWDNQLSRRGDAGLPHLHGLGGESLRQLRTNLRFADIDSTTQVLLVTSSIPAEGKTTTALGLSMAIAAAGKSVILVEGDLRRPTISQLIGATSSRGTVAVLLGDSSVSDELIDVAGHPNLRVLVAGYTPPNPSELLGSRQMHDLLVTVREMCDTVIIDAPPLLPVTDAAVLGSNCDGALLVACHKRVRREQVRQSVALLRQLEIRIVGMVVNMYAQRNTGYYGGYYSRSAQPAEPIPDDTAAGDQNGHRRSEAPLVGPST